MLFFFLLCCSLNLSGKKFIQGQRQEIDIWPEGWNRGFILRFHRYLLIHFNLLSLRGSIFLLLNSSLLPALLTFYIKMTEKLLRCKFEKKNLINVFLKWCSRSRNQQCSYLKILLFHRLLGPWSYFNRKTGFLRFLRTILHCFSLNFLFFQISNVRLQFTVSSISPKVLNQIQQTR